MAVETTNQLHSAAPPAADPGRRAWRVLLVSFMGFCLLLSLACYGLWHFRAFARISPPKPALLRLESTSGVFLQQRGMVIRFEPQDGQPLQEGDTLYVDPTLGPGVAASVELFDGTQIELWPGSTLRMDTLQRTRFNNYRLSIGLSLQAGMARLRIPRRLPYQNADFTITARPPSTQPAQLSFDTGGEYLVRVLKAEAPMTARAQEEGAPATEVTVSSGQAQLNSGSRSTIIAGGQRVIVDDEGLAGPSPAAWQLVRDGNFSQFSEKEYNCTAVVDLCETDELSSTTWLVRSRASRADSPETGYFRMTPAPSSSKLPLQQGEQGNAANFTRYGSEGKGFLVYIQQQLAADVTPYSKLLFEADLRILHQSLPEAGEKGTECPITISWRYTDYRDVPNRSFDYCYYAVESNELNHSPEPYIKTSAIPLMQWTHVNLQLHEDIPDMRRIDELWIYANGHDYAVEVANVSLVAR